MTLEELRNKLIVDRDLFIETTYRGKPDNLSSRGYNAEDIRQLSYVPDLINYDNSALILSTINDKFGDYVKYDTLDLLNYYTKSQVDDKLNNLENSLSVKINKNEFDISDLQYTAETFDTRITTSENTANEALEIAKQSNKTKVFDNLNQLQSDLKGYSNEELIIGSNLLIKELNVPDWYVSGIKTSIGTDTLPTKDFNSSYHIGYYEISQLETQKVDLTNYMKLNDIKPNNSIGLEYLNTIYIKGKDYTIPNTQMVLRTWGD